MRNSSQCKMGIEADLHGIQDLFPLKPDRPRRGSSDVQNLFLTKPWWLPTQYGCGIAESVDQRGPVATSEHLCESMLISPGAKGRQPPRRLWQIGALAGSISVAKQLSRLTQCYCSVFQAWIFLKRCCIRCERGDHIMLRLS